MENNQKIELVADQIKISGPKADGSFNITLVVGEYMKHKLAPLMLMDNDKNYKITIEECDD